MTNLVMSQNSKLGSKVKTERMTFNPNKAGFLKEAFSEGAKFDSPFIFQEELIQYQYKSK